MPRTTTQVRQTIDISRDQLKELVELSERDQTPIAEFLRRAIDLSVLTEPDLNVSTGDELYDQACGITQFTFYVSQPLQRRLQTYTNEFNKIQEPPLEQPMNVSEVMFGMIEYYLMLRQAYDQNNSSISSAGSNERNSSDKVLSHA